MTREELMAVLLEHRDEKYADFAAKTIPTVPRERFIGIRSPEYPKILKEIRSDSIIPEFLSDLPHTYFEENCVHASLISGIKDFDACIEAVEAFLPYIDNWAVCDSLNPPVFAKNHDKLCGCAEKWIASPLPYTCRFGMHILMAHFLEEDFKKEYLERPAELRSDEYYINMMRAWLFAEALTKQWDAALPYITEHRLDIWTHNKTIQKACESYRVPEEKKTLLKTLRRKPERKKKA